LENNKQMKLYNLGCIKNNRKKEAVLPWWYRQ
jgi:hypothetical protein